MTNSWTYQIYGLQIKTDFQLPHLYPTLVDTPYPQPDVCISSNKDIPNFEVVTHKEHWEEMSFTRGEVDGQAACLIDYKEQGQYYIQGGRTIIARRGP
ncbi:MAG: hypothetical protein AAFP19_11915, partial [Bacteroidota bacterium]